MEISRLGDEFIEKKMNQSAKSQDVTSWSNFQMGWRSAIRFAKKVEAADSTCLQCGKLLSWESEEVRMDDGGNVFCNKCYKKLF